MTAYAHDLLRQARGSVSKPLAKGEAESMAAQIDGALGARVRA